MGHLDYPVTLVSANDFMAHGRLKQHEDVRDENQLVFKDSLAKVAVFKKTYKIVFFSHQWTAWTEPDHTSKQYKAMVEALQTVVTDFGWDLNKVYVWVDYISIPQCVGSVQLLAIHTLTAYSSVADAFIAVCPDLEHKETSASVGMDSYKHRMWCRAEQACFALKNGCDNMWMCTEKHDAGDNKLSLNVERMGQEWLKIVLKVFDGNATCCERKHVGMEQCDRQALVVPLLSLYSEWFAAQDIKNTAKETAKVHPEDDCNISIRAADGTTCVEEMNEQKNDLLPLEVDTTKNDEGPVMHKKGARGSRRPSSDAIEP